MYCRFTLLLLLFGVYGSFATSDYVHKQCVLDAVERCEGVTQGNEEPPEYYDYDYPPPAMLSPSPSPPPPQAPAPPVGIVRARMTRAFPLGSCKMNSLPSLPYELVYNSNNSTSLCLGVVLAKDWEAECAKYGKLEPCRNMVAAPTKLVFAFRLEDACGFNLFQGRRVGLYDWVVMGDDGRQVRAASYSFYARRGQTAHASGVVKAYNWEGIVNGESVSSVEVSLNRNSPFVKSGDLSLDGYEVCLSYDSDTVDLVRCISDNNRVVRYSFYDPYKTLCTVGSVGV